MNDFVKVRDVIDQVLERDGVKLRRPNSMIRMAKVIKKSEAPMKDSWKPGLYDRLSYEEKGWKSRFSHYWCPEHGYSYGLEITSHEIDVDDERYIVVAFVKPGTIKEKALTEFGFVRL